MTGILPSYWACYTSCYLANGSLLERCNKTHHRCSILYGLPSNTNWSIAISGLGYLKLFTSDTNVIYTYLPAGTYIYTVGSMINGSYHSGIVGQYIPSPATGHVIITNTFTVQVIIFSVNKVLKYNLDPEQASGVSNNVTLPILVVNIQGLPASNSTITMLLRSLTAELIAKDQKENQNLTWSISSSKNGMIVIFLHIGRLEIQAIENGTAVVSFCCSIPAGKGCIGLQCQNGRSH